MSENMQGEAGASGPPDFTLAPAEPVFAPLIPELRRLANAYRVSTSEVDAELLLLFVEQLQQVVAGLTRAMTARDEAGLRKGAHSLLGMGGTIGVPELSVVGGEMRAAVIQCDFGRCEDLLRALQVWMRLLETGVKGADGV